MERRPTGPSRILRELKDRTASRHEAVERGLDLPNRLRGSIAYADLLGRIYGFYSPHERALGSADGLDRVGIAFDARRKCPALAADLATLGRDAAALPTWSGPLDRPTLGTALGRLYVFEGATLGGRVISRMVRERLGLSPERGCAFFAGYGERTGEMWEAFRHAVVGFAVGGREEEEVVTAALDTFDQLDRWLAAAEGGT